jgi:hypothetical protein
VIYLLAEKEPHMNRKEIEERIWGKSISFSREHGIISKAEADFLLREYVKEYLTKVSSRSAKGRQPSSVQPNEAKPVKSSTQSGTKKGSLRTSRPMSEHTGRT